MNDQHPHAGYVGDDAYATGSFDTSAYATDPLFGTLPGDYDAGHSGQYDSSQWAAAATATTTQQWDNGGYTEYSEYTGQWDASAWNQAHEAQHADPAQQFATAAYDTTGQWHTAGFETGTYDATAWNYASTTETFVPEQYDYAAATEAHLQAGHETAYADHDTSAAYAGHDTYTGHEAAFSEPEPLADAEALAHAEHAVDSDVMDGFDSGPSTEILAEPVLPPESTDDTGSSSYGTAPAVTPRPVRRAGGGGSRGRRRTPAKRSALLTVAVPSACVMGVAGIAAASVSGLTGNEKKDDGKSVTAADPSTVKPVAANSALDTQLDALSADARDFGDRASRTQERIDLKARQEAERKKREEEAKRREAMRPKFALPVKLHQLSARYGQAGVNWMSLHTGIDFPVQYGTPVMAATDGTVRTQWNSAYGNMVIVTAKDGTETWYCHLSSAKIRSGEVKAGDVIAYSGNSGNSTGPHLHFEVRPGGGAAIDPEQWLRNHGLSPTG
ncbi:M23 family metallopeptidase [Streptomyces coeruleoprunus]|uniref:M23 family metallopeptidase n=1 Tax=Streptomyces coeruleoprunus TaxID=285563 RepID=A0ABV9XMI9_9ACTN